MLLQKAQSWNQSFYPLTWRDTLASSLYIRTPHPKTSIQPEPQAIKRILDMGWWGQAKMHGHRLQVHLHREEDPILYNRHGGLYGKTIHPNIIPELRRVLEIGTGWTAIEGEWVESQNKLYLFDYIKKDGKVLDGLSYEDRFALLPKLYISPSLQTLSVFKTLEQCLGLYEKRGNRVEGLVFKSTTSLGFKDTSIIRCRFAEED